jgi:hypothetical protein
MRTASDGSAAKVTLSMNEAAAAVVLNAAGILAKGFCSAAMNKVHQSSFSHW